MCTFILSPNNRLRKPLPRKVLKLDDIEVKLYIEDISALKPIRIQAPDAIINISFSN